MKKYLSILICVTILALMSGCRKDALSSTSSDEEKSAKIKELTEMNTISIAENNNVHAENNNVHAENNNVHAENTSNDSKNKQLPDNIHVPSNAVYCRFDNHGEYTFYDKHDNIIQLNNNDYLETHEYKYNEDETIAVEIYNDNLSFETYLYTYNTDKTLHRRQTQGNDEYNLYEYDEHGQVVHDYIMRESDGICMVATEYENIYENGKIIVHRDKGNNQVGIEKIYKYDEKGNITREITKSTFLKEVIMDSQLTYYEDGKLKSDNRAYPSDNITVLYEYDYIYF